jgi:hypothetical protein
MKNESLCGSLPTEFHKILRKVDPEQALKSKFDLVKELISRVEAEGVDAAVIGALIPFFFSLLERRPEVLRRVQDYLHRLLPEATTTGTLTDLNVGRVLSDQAAGSKVERSKALQDFKFRLNPEIYGVSGVEQEKTSSTLTNESYQSLDRTLKSLKTLGNNEILTLIKTCSTQSRVRDVRLVNPVKTDTAVSSRSSNSGVDLLKVVGAARKFLKK